MSKPDSKSDGTLMRKPSPKSACSLKSTPISTPNYKSVCTPWGTPMGPQASKMILGHQEGSAFRSAWKMVKCEDVSSDKKGTVWSVQDLVKPNEEVASKSKWTMFVALQEEVQVDTEDKNYYNDDEGNVKNWMKLYFPSLLLRHKWHTNRMNLKVDDVC